MFSDQGEGRKGCPTLNRKAVLKEANKEYEVKDVNHLRLQRVFAEAECYANRDQQPYIMQPCKTRIVEICEFAMKMGYKRLGLAFCIGMTKEARIVEEILKGMDLRWPPFVVKPVTAQKI